MSSSSYFWANLGILQKVGVWTPYYGDRNTPSFGKTVYDVYRRVIIVFASLHTAAELAIIALDLKSLSLDDLTCSIAYSIQHFLGIVKVYIIISQQDAILELDNRTKKHPLFRENDPKFLKAVRKTVNLSDRIGYIYWFFVLITISFGCMTGVWVTYHNRKTMNAICNEKLDYYQTNFEYNNNRFHLNYTAARTIDEFIQSDNKLALYLKVDAIEAKLRYLNISTYKDNDVCTKPRRVFPYHIWLPFDGKYSPFYHIIFVLNFLGGFCLVLVILPIDLLVMSYMRYIRFQFELIRKDLVNLRDDSIMELDAEIKEDEGIPIKIDEDALLKIQLRKIKKIRHHQLAVYDFFDRTNDLFTWVLFAQYLGSAVMICGVLYSISSVVGDILSPKFFHVAFFYSGLLFQLYSNCYYGSQVLILSSGIAEFAYFSGWQIGSATKLKPYIMMIMNRSLRPCKLTAGKFAGVDLPTFLAVFKASYTYYNLLVNDPRQRK